MVLVDFLAIVEDIVVLLGWRKSCGEWLVFLRCLVRLGGRCIWIKWQRIK